MSRILIVEDDEDVRLAMAVILEDAGYEVFVAADAAEGLDSVLVRHPDLVLLDIVMPKVDGFEVLTTLKADARTRDIPVVMITAKSSSEDSWKARTLGASDCIIKPWRDGEVERRVGRVLGAVSAV